MPTTRSQETALTTKPIAGNVVMWRVISYDVTQCACRAKTTACHVPVTSHTRSISGPKKLPNNKETKNTKTYQYITPTCSSNVRVSRWAAVLCDVCIAHLSVVTTDHKLYQTTKNHEPDQEMRAFGAVRAFIRPLELTWMWLHTKPAVQIMVFLVMAAHDNIVIHTN